MSSNINVERDTWSSVRLKDILDYEQPTNYVVKSAEYNDAYETPVLTAGKSFLLGYTNENIGIFPKEKLPVIIFDDFTTASKFVDFPFKVKSSAMKILTPKKEVEIKFIFHMMERIKFGIRSHKRYWISEYSHLSILLPSLSEQKAIVSLLEKWDIAIEKTEALIAAKQKQFEWLTKKLLENQKQPLKRLDDLFKKEVTIEKGKPLKKIEISKGRIPVIAGGRTSPYTHNVPTHSIPCVTISTSGAYAGYVQYHTTPIWASDCNVIYSQTNLTEYLYYALKSKQQQIYNLQSGGGQPHVYAKDIKKLTIPLPSLHKQKNIVYKLSTAQHEITLLKKLVEQYQKQKRGLMQKLLTGKWRILR